MKYTVKDMRVLFPSEKVATRRPTLFATVTGTFTDGKGNPLSITRKEITIEMAQSADFVLDIEKGIFQIPSGKRGRKASAGASKMEIEQRLKALKG